MCRFRDCAAGLDHVWITELRTGLERQLGELAGVGLRFVSELERGKSTLRMDATNRVLAAFGMMLGPVEAPRSEDGES